MTLRRTSGFTLLEMIAVVVILALLLVLIVPSYQQHVRDTRRTVAAAALMEAMIRQEQFFVEHRRYAERLSDLEFPAHPAAIDREGKWLAVESEERIYTIDLDTDANAYTLSATPQLGQAADRLCGTLFLDATGDRRASGELPARECW